MSDYTYDAIVRAVHDGDTITCDVDLGFDIWIHGLKLRLYGLNAPELQTPMGKIAQVFLSQQLPLGQKVVINTVKDKQEKYGRILATVIKTVPPQAPSNPALAPSTTIIINALLISSGNAKPWDGKGERPV